MTETISKDNFYPFCSTLTSLEILILKFLGTKILLMFMHNGAGWRMQAMLLGLEFWSFFAIGIRYNFSLKNINMSELYFL